MSEIKQAMVKNPPFPKSYADTMLVLQKGKGVYLYDVDGKKYLDFGSGISVNALGHGRGDLASTAAKQMKKVVHVSNLYATEPSIDLAQRLISFGNYAAVHFGNSGSEANEAAIKFARQYALRKSGKGKHGLLCFENAFHGRTLGALSCTPNPKYQDPFGPLIPGVVSSPFNNSEQLRKKMNDKFAAVIVEVVQGEGGLEVMSAEFAKSLVEECGKHKALLIVDEIQTGLGRCGYKLASDKFGLEPDIVTLSKPLAGGLPLSATLIPAEINDTLHVGDHGTTFGGGPVTTAVAGRVLDVLLAPGFMQEVQEKGEHLAQALQQICDNHPTVAEEVRGMGLLRGLAVKPEVQEKLSDVLTAAQENGLLLLRSGKNVIRIAPPLVITTREIDDGIALFDEVLKKFD